MVQSHLVLWGLLPLGLYSLSSYRLWRMLPLRNNLIIPPPPPTTWFAHSYANSSIRPMTTCKALGTMAWSWTPVLPFLSLSTRPPLCCVPHYVVCPQWPDGHVHSDPPLWCMHVCPPQPTKVPPCWALCIGAMVFPWTSAPTFSTTLVGERVSMSGQAYLGEQEGILKHISCHVMEYS
jgi:hypothetical protein